MMQKAASTRFERTPYGFVCASSELTSVWSASRVQVEPDGESPTLDQMREMAELPSQWIPELRHRTAMIAHSDENREVAWSLAREGWNVTELWLLICRVPPKVPAAAKPVEGEARRRIKGRLGVELGLPPDKTPSSTATTSSEHAPPPTSPTAATRKAGRSRLPRCSCVETSPRSRTSRRSAAPVGAAWARQP